MNPFTDIGRNAAAGFTGWNILLHTGAVLSTVILVETDTDYKVHAYFNRTRDSHALADPAAYIGYLTPLVLGSSIYLYGNIGDHSKEIAAGSAMLQASLVGLVYDWTLKAFTGRVAPDPDTYDDMRSASHKFRFGFLRGGVHWGWPSGHLMVNTAAMTSLAYFYHENTLIKVLCITYLGYMFYGVNAHEGGTMHWFSDTVAGTLMGFAIGSSIGKNFRQEWDKHTATDRSDRFQAGPILAGDSKGVFFNLSF
ncbi:MAG: phosphatase PAP2 family protein [bacterium]|nr:phosphatase PAP2 family protein [bacterium]